MRRLVYLVSARRDLNAILRYVPDESGSAGQALRFVGSLRAQCSKLAVSPLELGRARSDLQPDLRGFSSGNYIIFFRYHLEVLEVVKVVERHREMTALFGDAAAKH